MAWGVLGILLKSVRMNLDGVPHGVDMEKVRLAIVSADGAEDAHHVHVWSLSTTENALTAHVVVSSDADVRKMKSQIRHALLHANVHHATLETECEKCGEEGCG